MMANLLLQHERGWDQGESIGKNQRPIATEKTKHSPDGNAADEEAVHR